MPYRRSLLIIYFIYGCVLNLFSRIQLFATLWTVAHQPPLSMGFSRQETGVHCHFLLQGIFPTQGSNPHLFRSPALTGGFFTTSTTWEALLFIVECIY